MLRNSHDTNGTKDGIGPETRDLRLKSVIQSRKGLPRVKRIDERVRPTIRQMWCKEGPKKDLERKVNGKLKKRKRNRGTREGSTAIDPSQYDSRKRIRPMRVNGGGCISRSGLIYPS